MTRQLCTTTLDLYLIIKTINIANFLAFKSQEVVQRIFSDLNFEYFVNFSTLFCLFSYLCQLLIKAVSSLLAIHLLEIGFTADLTESKKDCFDFFLKIINDFCIHVYTLN